MRRDQRCSRTRSGFDLPRAASCVTCRWSSVNEDVIESGVNPNSKRKLASIEALLPIIEGRSLKDFCLEHRGAAGNDQLQRFKR